MKSNNYISEAQAEAVSAAVHAAELKTAGEIVPVVAERSDSYAGATWRIAVVFMLLAANAIAYFLPDISLETLLMLQLPALLVGLMVGALPAVERIAVNKKELAEEVHQRALQVFFNQKLHSTKDRTGVLIYVSLLEHRVEILADTGINERIEQAEWDYVVQDLLADIKRDALADGLVKAIASCGDKLAKHFPIAADDTNELNNALILM